jgi:hypothetical protein
MNISFSNMKNKYAIYPGAKVWSIITTKKDTYNHGYETPKSPESYGEKQIPQQSCGVLNPPPRLRGDYSLWS